MTLPPCDDVTLGDWRVLFAPDVAPSVDPFRQRRRCDREGGGVLLGEVADGVLLVTRASHPTPLDRRSRRHFVRHQASAQQAIDFAHAESSGRWTYLGEWHTHPARTASPSGQDHRMIRRQHEVNDVPAGVLLLLILGLRSDYLGLWDGSSLCARRCRLN